MSWVRSGSCNQCGQCCLANAIAPFMCNLTHTQCKYLVKVGNIYICDITDGKFSDPENLLIVSLLPQKDYEYWKSECVPYPNEENEAHQSQIHSLPVKCSYTIDKEAI